MSDFQRVTSPWIEFKNVRNTAKGAKLMSLPDIEMTMMRGDKKTIGGRNGIMYVSDGAYEETTVQVDFGIPDGANLSSVFEWLRGSGHLVLSTDANYYRDAMVITAGKAQPMGRLNAYKLTATFTCDPVKHLVSEQPLVYTERPAAFAGQGQVDTKPLLKIEGNGNIELTVNNCILRATVASGTPLFVDCDAKIAYTETTVGGVAVRVWAGDTVELLTDWVYMSPDSNTVIWTNASTITRLTIYPRWGWF